MRDEVARAALRAAAGLALTTAVLGCGQVVLDQREARGTGSGGGPAGSGGAGGVATTTEPPGCSGPGGTPGEEVACCSDLAHEAFPDGGVSDPASAAPEVKACCGVLAAHYDALLASVGGSGGAVADPWNWNADGDVKWSCCASIDWASTTCTPWGPPVPPALPPGRARPSWLEVA